MEVIKKNKVEVKRIITALKNGAVLVLPTDTVYGLVCDAGNITAVEKIFQIKKRDKQKPLPIFVKDIDQAKELAFIDYKQESFLKENWPGAVTVILKTKQKISNLLSKDGTIGLRMPNCSLLNEILNKFNGPLAQTSANISGEQVITKIEDILEKFSDQDIFMIDAGDLPDKKPSKIINLTGGVKKTLRP